MNSVPGTQRAGACRIKTWSDFPCDCTGGLFSHSLIEQGTCQPYNEIVQLVTCSTHMA